MKTAAKRKVIIALTAVLLLLTMNYVFAGMPIEQRSTLSGKVSTVGLVHVGQIVKEGTPLVHIEGMVGATPTTRANVDGIVVEVNVKPGDLVLPNQVVAKIERR